MKLFATVIRVFKNCSFSSNASSFSTFTKRVSEKSSNEVKRRKGSPGYPRPPPGMKWTDEQKKIFCAIKDDKASLFITGSAGTGKTVLLQHVIELLKKIHGKSSVFVTASTGVAACALKGLTLHSFAGIGIGDHELMLDRVLSNGRACKRWKKAKALVVDEISMVDAALFEKLEFVARSVRDNDDDSWGGIQLVVSGDFFQLPPVKQRNSLEGKIFAFEADCWGSSFDLQVELTKVFRQSDAQLIKLLQSIRTGVCNSDELQLLEQCCSSGKPDPTAVQLYPIKEHVKNVNEKKMQELGMEEVIYSAVDFGLYQWINQFDKGNAAKEISLCEGARVMLVKNLNTRQGLANGVTGTITGFTKTYNMEFRRVCKDGLLPIVKFDCGLETVIEPQIWEVREGNEVVANRLQIPLILAWALSIHKCQGMTLDKVHTDLSTVFEYGMVYVALSRVRSLEGLNLSGFHPSRIKVHPKVAEFYEDMSREHDKKSESDSNSIIINCHYNKTIEVSH